MKHEPMTKLNVYQVSIMYRPIIMVYFRFNNARRPSIRFSKFRRHVAAFGPLNAVKMKPKKNGRAIT